MVKVTLDENCGKTEIAFTSRRSFTSHVKTHSHVNPFVEKIGGGCSKRGSDQVTEAAHQLLMSRMERSKYWIRKVGTEAEGEGLFKAVVHTDTYNM